MSPEAKAIIDDVLPGAGTANGQMTTLGRFA